MAEEMVHFNYRDQRPTMDANHIFGESNKAFWRCTRFAFTMILLVLILGGALAGSILTHFSLDGLGPSLSHFQEWQIRSVQGIVVAVPLGCVVGLVSFNFRAGLVLSILTMCSLYVAWDSYVPYADVHEEGVFDFLLGIELNNSGAATTLFREYAGISLWGLVLTFPSGYILYTLGFGSTYALSGSLIGLSYLITTNSDIGLGELSCNDSTCAYYIWGFLIWFVVLIMSVIRLCKTIRYVVSKAKQPVFLRCYQFMCYNKLYTSLFEILAFLFSLFLLCSLMYLALVDMDRNKKAPVFFGLLCNILAMISTQAYRTGRCVDAWLRKRRNKVRTTSINRLAVVQNPRPLTATARRDTNTGPPTYNQVLGAEPNLYPEIIEDRERAIPAQLDNRILEDENNVEGFPNERTTLFREQQVERKKILHGCYMGVFFFQRFIYTDILRVIQLLFDLVGGLFLSGTVALTVLAALRSWGNPRFGDQL